VLNSRGSIIPVIEKQIKAGGPVTITDPDMTRFIITIEQAVNLVFKATHKSKGGEIFILKMPSLKVIDLVEVLIGRICITVWFFNRRYREEDNRSKSQGKVSRRIDP